MGFRSATQADIDTARRRVEDDEKNIAEEEHEKEVYEADIRKERLELIALLAEQTKIKQSKSKSLRGMR